MVTLNSPSSVLICISFGSHLRTGIFLNTKLFLLLFNFGALLLLLLFVEFRFVWLLRFEDTLFF